MSLFKNAVASLGLTMAFVPAALGQAALNADGFKENPVCEKHEYTIKTYEDMNQYPVGPKVSTPRFDLVLRVKVKKDGQLNENVWGLEGDNRKGQSCTLAASRVSSYKDQPWFRRYFSPDQSAPKN